MVGKVRKFKGYKYLLPDMKKKLLCLYKNGIIFFLAYLWQLQSFASYTSLSVKLHLSQYVKTHCDFVGNILFDFGILM